MSHCGFGNCNSDSRPGRPGYDASVKFFPFPQPCLMLRDNVLEWDNSAQKTHTKLCEKCRLCWEWMVKCRRKDERFSSVRFVRPTTRICSKHFAKPVPIKMDFCKYFPLSSVPTEGCSRYRKRSVRQAGTSKSDMSGENRAPVGQDVAPKTALPSQESGTQMENMAFMPSALVSEGPYDAGFLELMQTETNDKSTQAHTLTCDVSTQTMSQTREASSLTTWIVRDVDEFQQPSRVSRTTRDNSVR